MKKQYLSVAILSTALTIMVAPATADHHELIMPLAKAGQLIVTYKGECPSGAVDGAIAKVKETIAYERKNSPVLYASSPGVWAGGKVGAVDVHESKEAMDKAFAWQAADATWSANYDDIAASCGVTVADFEVSIFEAR